MVLWFKSHLAWIIVAILTMSCVLLAYSWIDTLVTLDYARQGQEDQRRKINLLQGLVQETSSRLTRSEITELVKKKFRKDHIIKEDSDRLQVDNIVFKFKGESLAEIEFLD